MAAATIAATAESLFNGQHYPHERIFYSLSNHRPYTIYVSAKDINLITCSC